jgi:hypothetical protein
MGLATKKPHSRYLLMNLICGFTEFSNVRFWERKKIYRNEHGILAPPLHRENGLQMWKAADNTRKKQHRTADKGDPPISGLGGSIKIASTHNKNNVTRCLLLVTISLMSYIPQQVLLHGSNQGA